MNDNIPSLKFEANGDGTITLEQEWSGNVDRVAIHSVHVRYLAERLGMVREVSASDAELLRTERGHVAALCQESDRLKRNMLRLHAHALALQADFRENADFAHADLSHELSNINALVDLFDMAVDDFADHYTAHDPSGNPRVTQVEPSAPAAMRAPATGPKTDGFGTPPKTGALGVGSDATPAGAMSHQLPPRDGKASAKASPQLELEA